MNLPKLNTWAVCLKVIPGAGGMARLSEPANLPPSASPCWGLGADHCLVVPIVPYPALLATPCASSLQLPTL